MRHTKRYAIALLFCAGPLSAHAQDSSLLLGTWCECIGGNELAMTFNPVGSFQSERVCFETDAEDTFSDRFGIWEVLPLPDNLEGECPPRDDADEWEPVFQLRIAVELVCSGSLEDRGREGEDDNECRFSDSDTT